MHIVASRAEIQTIIKHNANLNIWYWSQPDLTSAELVAEARNCLCQRYTFLSRSHFPVLCQQSRQFYNEKQVAYSQFNSSITEFNELSCIWTVNSNKIRNILIFYSVDQVVIQMNEDSISKLIHLSPLF